MDIFEVSILKISRVQHGKRGVFVDAVTNTYGVTTAETLYFSNRIWPRIQAQMMFLESERDGADFTAAMSSICPMMSITAALSMTSANLRMRSWWPR